MLRVDLNANVSWTELLVQLGKLSRAIMDADKVWLDIPAAVRIETGNAVALLGKCVKEEDDGTDKRPAESEAGEEGSERGGGNTAQARNGS